MAFLLIAAVVLADLEDGHLTLADVSTVAVIGGVLLEAAVRTGKALGIESEVDGWREGMFFGAVVAMLSLLFGELDA